MIITERIPIDTTDWVESENQKLQQTSDPDDLIDAHLSGIKIGLNKKEMMIQQAFDKNIEEALNSTSDLYKDLESDINPVGMFLKVHNISSYEVLILVDKNSYLNSVNRKLAYEKIRKIENNIKSNIFKLSITLKPNSENTSETAINANGFFYKYEPKSRQA
jgi:hypothetical protein